jgi:hypothetical protein
MYTLASTFYLTPPDMQHRQGYVTISMHKNITIYQYAQKYYHLQAPGNTLSSRKNSLTLMFLMATRQAYNGKDMS